jgi:RNA polymerase sigma-70 factor (ECF subfamily)
MERGTNERASATTDDEDDRSLVQRLRAGDEAAYEQLVRAHSGRLLSVARRLLGSEEEARDAVQDAFVSAYRSLGGFEGHARLSTWLHQIVVNASLMKLRSKRRHPEEPIEDLLPRFLDDGHQAEPADSWGDGPLARLELEERRGLVRDAIGRLPENYRTVLMLRDIEEVDTATAAAALGVSENVVKTRLHRARQALRSLLDAKFRRKRR